MDHDKIIRRSNISLMYLWAIVFFILPLTFIFIASLLKRSPHDLFLWQFTLENYRQLISIPYLKVFWRSIKFSFYVTLICLLIGYPFAYQLTKLPKKTKSMLALLVIIPFWTSSLLRSFAIITLLQAQGILNTLLLYLHVIHKPLQLLYTNTAVLIGLVYNLLPFVILPLFANMEKLDTSLLEAAEDLGASKWQVVWSVLLPMTRTGISSSIMLTFLPAITLFYIPDLLGGSKSVLLGNLIQMEFFTARNWPMGSAVGISLTLLMSMMITYYLKTSSEELRGDN